MASPSRLVIKLLAALTLLGGAVNVAHGVRVSIAYARSVGLPAFPKALGTILGPIVALLGVGAIIVAILTYLHPTSRPSRLLSAFIALFLCQAARAAIHPLLSPPSYDMSRALTVGEKVLAVVNLLTLIVGYLIYRAVRSWLAPAPQLSPDSAKPS
jgi:hypothetical protein